jgi:hypothetical protein
MSRTLVLALVLTIGGGIACGRNGVTVPSSAAPGGTAIPTTATASAAGLVYVDGVITSIDGNAQSFVVRDTTVNVPSTAVIRAEGATVTFADLKIGEHVHVRGISTAMGRVTASEIVAEGVPPANTIVVTGAVASLAGTCPSLTFTVGGTTVRTSQTTTFDRGGCAQVVNGRTVRVEGVKETDGSIQAGRVDLEEVPR